MTGPTEPASPDPTRTGAVWVTGTGAFLLLAAAAVFTAVRWGEIPDAAKLGAIGARTGGFLLAGRGLRADPAGDRRRAVPPRRVPRPVDVAAAGVRGRARLAGAPARRGRRLVRRVRWAPAERSVVLRWASGSPAWSWRPASAPPPTSLRPSCSAAWPSPLAVVVAMPSPSRGRSSPAPRPGVRGRRAAGVTGRGVLDHLGLTGHQPRWPRSSPVPRPPPCWARSAKRRGDAAVALVAAAAAGLGGCGGIVDRHGSGPGHDRRGPELATFLLVELVAFAHRAATRSGASPARHRRGWWPSGRRSGGLPPSPPSSSRPSRSRRSHGHRRPGSRSPSPPGAVGWLVADRRRGGRGGLVSPACRRRRLRGGAVAAAWSTSLAARADASSRSWRSPAVFRPSGRRFPITVIAATWAPLAVHDTAAGLVATSASPAACWWPRPSCDRRRQLVSGPRPVDDVAEQWACAAGVALLPGRGRGSRMLADGFEAGGGGQLAAPRGRRPGRDGPRPSVLDRRP